MPRQVGLAQRNPTVVAG